MCCVLKTNNGWDIYPLDIYPGYISKYWIYDIDIYPFEILDMLIYPQMDLDLRYVCFIKYLFGHCLSDMDPFKIRGSGYDIISKKVDMI